ncbi:hypothetical protein M407DRAFT_243318 [Tulasnella calospora MUT 4182]|uniref:Uncharacterized protein n=1 Tax=Tulasnella calospora MUT 4182 TaxID=1051891 RepID=A0A0C3L1H4_9AGAM|nr:hypothetical protein M407DRAFT_243318 [Tulasnella calospora MUT 4182]
MLGTVPASDDTPGEKYPVFLDFTLPAERSISTFEGWERVRGEIPVSLLSMSLIVYDGCEGVSRPPHRPSEFPPRPPKNRR